MKKKVKTEEVTIARHHAEIATGLKWSRSRVRRCMVASTRSPTLISHMDGRGYRWI
jgi:hypothetical protein